MTLANAGAQSRSAARVLDQGAEKAGMGTGTIVVNLAEGYFVKDTKPFEDVAASSVKPVDEKHTK
jgi:hypothetical protein